MIFQAAGPTIDSIQGTVDAYRAALGEPNNANAPGPLASGRREINWDGGGARHHYSPGHAVQCFPKHPRRSVHHTGGRPFAGSPIGRAYRVALKGSLTIRPTATTFSTFSPLRLFTPVGSNLTEACILYSRLHGTSSQQRSVASARSSQMLTSQMGSDLA